MDHYTYVFVGNSAGAMAAVRELRAVGGRGSVLMLSEEPYAAYSRPLIAKHVSEGKGIDAMQLAPASYYADEDIQLRRSTRVVSIDYSKHTLALADGASLKWDRLLLATGSTPIVPSIPGTNLGGVFTFATFDDAKAVAARLPVTRHAVVIGGGFIGLSAADALLKRGVSVTVVELQPRLLGGMLDTAASHVVEAAACKAGACVITGRRVVSIDADKPGSRSVTSVSLDDGTRLPCELVVLAVGVRARTELAGKALPVARGIVVDEHMRTADPDVFACGDASQGQDFVRGVSAVTAIWPNAVAGGAVAGANMAGLNRAYEGSTTMNALPYFGLSLAAAGIVDDDSPGTETITGGSGRSYRKVILKDNIVVGMLFAGATDRCGLIYTLMKRRTLAADFKRALVDEEFGLLSLPETLWHELTAGSAPSACEVS